MKAVRVVLVPREVFRVVLGTVSARAVRSGMACLSSSAPEMALTEPGTSWINSARRRAVTTTRSSSRLPLAVLAIGRRGLGVGGADADAHGGKAHHDGNNGTPQLEVVL